MFPQPLINDESRKILPVKVFASSCIGVEEHRIMLNAKTVSSPYQETLTTVVDTVSAAKKFVHVYTFLKYFWML
jgi:hypothetical protein